MQIKISKSGVQKLKDTNLTISDFLIFLYFSKFQSGSWLHYSQIAQKFDVTDGTVKRCASKLKGHGFLEVKPQGEKMIKTVTKKGHEFLSSNEKDKKEFFLYEVAEDVCANVFIQYLVYRVENSELTIFANDTVLNILVSEKAIQYGTELLRSFFELDQRTAKKHTENAINNNLLYLYDLQDANTQIFSTTEIKTSVESHKISLGNGIDTDLKQAIKHVNRFIKKHNDRKTELSQTEKQQVSDFVKVLQDWRNGDVQEYKTFKYKSNVSKNVQGVYLEMINVLDEKTKAIIQDLAKPSNIALFNFQNNVVNAKDEIGESLYSFEDVCLVFEHLIYLWNGSDKFQKNLNATTIFKHFSKYQKNAKEWQDDITLALSRFGTSAKERNEIYKAWLKWRDYLKVRGTLFLRTQDEITQIDKLFELAKSTTENEINIISFASVKTAIEIIDFSMVSQYRSLVKNVKREKPKAFLTKEERNAIKLKEMRDYSEKLKQSIGQEIRNIHGFE